MLRGAAKPAKALQAFAEYYSTHKRFLGITNLNPRRGISRKRLIVRTLCQGLIVVVSTGILVTHQTEVE